VRIRPLTELGARELRPLLQEEASHWGRELYWDFQDVAAAVLGSIERRGLSGRVVQEAGRAVAYGYYMTDSSRAVVGSLFAAQSHRDRGIEEGLLDAMLTEAQGLAGPDRVECQTLFSTASGADSRFARSGFTGRRRHYMVRDLGRPLPEVSRAFRLRPFRREDMGLGLGTELMLACLHTLARRGLRSASLSVTVENHHAYDMYLRLGFELRREFAAHAWARPPLRVRVPA
jgi:GNAT superfamily N-acetyltransferase